MTRTIVISGGASGIGLASARWFAERGDEVWIVGRRTDALDRARSELAEADGSIHPVAADLSTAAGAGVVREALGERAVDVIVCAAGGTAARTPTELDDVAEEWERDIRQNLLTAVLLVEALRPRLVRPGGRVIGLGSIGAQLGSGYGGSYGAAKAALQAWTFWLATDLGPDGVTTNLVVPGYVPDTEFFGDRRNPAFDAARVDRSAVKRAGTSAEVAATIGFLASPDAGYITGQLIGVNGGMVLGR